MISKRITIESSSANVVIKKKLYFNKELLFQVQVSIGEKILIGLATGTASFLTALPAPPVPKISAGNSWKDSKKLSEMQKQLQETVKKNKDFYQLKTFTVREPD